MKQVAVKKELADKNVKFIADINVLDGDNVVKISDTKMKIRIALTEDLKGYNKYEVVYILNDEIKETIPATVEDGYIVFETSHLSQYGIIATNTASGDNNPGGDTNSGGTSTPGGNTTPSGDNNPQTGDNSNLDLWFALMLLGGGAAVGTEVVSRKKKYNR